MFLILNKQMTCLVMFSLTTTGQGGIILKIQSTSIIAGLSLPRTKIRPKPQPPLGVSPV